MARGKKKNDLPNFGIKCIKQDFECVQSFGQDELGMSARKEEDKEWEFG